MKDGETLLDVRDLRVSFPQPGRGLLGRTRNVAAVRGISFSIDAGETLGLVGRVRVRQIQHRSSAARTQSSFGRLHLLSGTRIARLDSPGHGDLRDKIQMVFQDPYSSLDPSMTVLDIVAEAGGHETKAVEV
jgi:ABC-type microcin C transport system duplicated ATPase subunit YejF